MRHDKWYKKWKNFLIYNRQTILSCADGLTITVILNSYGFTYTFFLLEAVLLTYAEMQKTFDIIEGLNFLLVALTGFEPVTCRV